MRIFITNFTALLRDQKERGNLYRQAHTDNKIKSSPMKWTHINFMLADSQRGYPHPIHYHSTQLRHDQNTLHLFSAELLD